MSLADGKNEEVNLICPDCQRETNITEIVRIEMENLVNRINEDDFLDSEATYKVKEKLKEEIKLYK
tara:strand:- start:772 stop:969 length:198 start_codon:yes stop_codon:yes gene_type:complete